MTHFEYMQQQGQITIFDCMNDEQPLQVGDQVKCIVTEEQDLEAYYFLKYYHPQALTSVGEVVQVEGKAIMVRFRLEYVLVNMEHLSRQ